MAARRKSERKSKRVYIICTVVTVIVLGVIFGVHRYKISQVAPVYVLKVDNLNA